MIYGEHLSERMVDVAHGRGAWSAGEAAHLRDCPECAAEWRLIVGAAAVGGGIEIDVERVAASVVGRLAAHRRTVPVRRWVVGLAAAAAVTFAVLRTEPWKAPDSVGPEAPVILSELDDLTPAELLTVLDVLDPVPAEASSDAGAARLGDLTTSELERVLRSLEG